MLAALLDLAGHLGVDGEAVLDSALTAVGIDAGVAVMAPCLRGSFAATRFAVAQQPGFESFDRLIEAVSDSSLSPRAAHLVVETAARMAGAERAVHGERVPHLHELSMLDTAVDLIAVAGLVQALDPETVRASPPALGAGHVNTAHGRLSVPVPAVVKLLEGLPTAGGGSPEVGELTTPTGAALLTELVSTFGALPAGRLLAYEVGAGERETPGGPNVLRALAVESHETGEVAASLPSSSYQGLHEEDDPAGLLLSTGRPRRVCALLAYGSQRAHPGAPALDVFVQMKVKLWTTTAPCGILASGAGD